MFFLNIIYTRFTTFCRTRGTGPQELPSSSLATGSGKEVLLHMALHFCGWHVRKFRKMGITEKQTRGRGQWRESCIWLYMYILRMDTNCISLKMVRKHICIYLHMMRNQYVSVLACFACFGFCMFCIVFTTEIVRVCFGACSCCCSPSCVNTLEPRGRDVVRDCQTVLVLR